MKDKKKLIIGLIVLAVVAVIIAIVASLSFAAPLENDVKVEEDSELTYYIDVIYDGKDGGSYYDRAIVTSDGYNKTVNNAGAHTHSLTPSGAVTSTFSGKTVTTSSNGGGSSIDIMNPYITVYIWRRTA